MVQAGQYVTDGTAVFIVTDIRDGAQVGDIKLSPVLRKGYVKANGALLTSARTNYPRLVQFLKDNPSLNAGNDTAWNSNKALYVYNATNNTLRVPDATGRVLQGGASAGMLAAGLPNVTGRANTGVGQSGSDAGIFRPELTAGCFGHDGNASNTFTVSNNRVPTKPQLLFDASSSNPIYSNSQTVQPPALVQIAQIRY